MLGHELFHTAAEDIATRCTDDQAEVLGGGGLSMRLTEQLQGEIGTGTFGSRGTRCFGTWKSMRTEPPQTPTAGIE
jgi:hypothetical protein